MSSSRFFLASIFIQINENKRIAVYHSGKPDVSPKLCTRIFFIHGVGGSSWIWRHQVAYFLSLGYEVIALDLPGHGRSPIPSDNSGPQSPFLFCLCKPTQSDVTYRSLSFRELCADVLTVFDHFTCDDSAADSTINVLVAHSYGTSLAVHVAHERSKNVHRLVLISGGAPDPLEPLCWPSCLPLFCFSCLWTCVVRNFRRNAFAVQCSSKLKKVLGPDKNKDIVSPHHSFLSSSSSLSKNDKLSNHFTEEDIRNSFSIDPVVLRATMCGQSWPEGDALYHQTIKVPTLLLIGDRDKYVTVEEEAIMLQALSCSTMRIIHGAGHMVMLENPEKVSHYIQSVILYPPQLVAPRKNSTHEQLRTEQPIGIIPPVSD